MTATGLCLACGRYLGVGRTGLCDACTAARTAPSALTAPAAEYPVVSTGSVNLDRPCPHGDFVGVIAVARIMPEGAGDDPPPDTLPIGYNADIRVSCAQCGEPFRWTGLRAGLSQAYPMVSVDELELRAPIRPASSDPDFGLGIPGFSIGVWAQPAGDVDGEATP